MKLQSNWGRKERKSTDGRGLLEESLSADWQKKRALASTYKTGVVTLKSLFVRCVWRDMRHSRDFSWDRGECWGKEVGVAIADGTWMSHPTAIELDVYGAPAVVLELSSSQLHARWFIDFLASGGRMIPDAPAGSVLYLMETTSGRLPSTPSTLLGIGQISWAPPESAATTNRLESIFFGFSSPIFCTKT